ncbi:MAG: nitroreductase family protein [Acidobacteria bacterium]|nr:nitroreductase family protein [Acidobacteriota bacterium]MBU4495515.1 nitroreductase family protein [Acidobacteriota bacterium]
MAEQYPPSMSHVQQLIHSRRSVRRWLDKPVERSKINLCLEAARLAPSAENVQPWRFLVMDDPLVIEPFSRHVFNGIYSMTRFAAKAPVLVLVLGRLDFLANRLAKQIQDVRYYLIDIGIAGEHFVLQAEEQGLGTCWIGWFDMKKARKFFGLPRSYKVVSLLAVGYPDKTSDARPKKRREFNEIVWYNRYEKR